MEITRSLKDDDRVHQNFRISTSSFMFSFYSCWIFNLDMFSFLLSRATM